MLQQGRKVIAPVAALAALAVGGAAIASAATSQSTSTTTPTPSSTLSSSNSQHPPAFSGPAHGTAAHENAEKPVTGAAAAKAKTDAVKAVGSGTAGAVTTDLPGTGYETTVTKADGSKVEVHLDSAFNAVQAPGGPGGPGSRLGSPRGAPPGGYGG